MLHCIIHPELLYAERNLPTHPPEQKERIERACRTVEDIIETEPNIIISRGMHPSEVQHYCAKEDRVLLSGAYLRACLQVAYDSLRTRGIEVEYHPHGCI